MKNRFWAALVLAGLACLMIGPGLPARADDKDEKAPEGTKERGEAVKQIGMAFDLAALGRKTRSPEMLISAASILRQYRAEQSDAAPKGEGDDKPEAAKLLSLKDTSDGLLAEAKKMAEVEKVDKKMIADLADYVAEKGRGSTIGTRTRTHRILNGRTHTYALRFFKAAPANVSVTGNGVNTLTLVVTGPTGRFGTWTGPNPAIAWTPLGTGNFTITVTNNGPGPCVYTLFHN